MVPAEAPYLSVRPLRSGDFRSAAAFVPRRLISRDGSAVPVDGVGACESLLAAGMMLGAALTRPSGEDEKVIALGGGVFVTDEYLEEQKSASWPGLAERVLHSVLIDASPVLDPAAVERRNGIGGLNLIVMFHEWDRERTSEDLAREIRMHLVKAFLNDVRGYRLREILAECSGDEDLQWALAGGGFHLRDSYDAWYSVRDWPAPRRYLVGATPQEALALPSNVISLLFHYREPVCGFTRSERRLLQVALACETDAEIASALDISPSGVKKRWTAIFDRVAGSIPELATDAPRGMTRGPQKRHRLLAFLREHPEELRP